MRARRLPASAAAALLALAMAACGPRAPQPPEVASGTAEAEVLEQAEGEPVAEETLAIEDHPALTFTIKEFRYADPETGGGRSTWMLFDGNGFVGRGPGTARDAKARAYDLYYATMADHGTMPRSRAESEYAAKLREIYGDDLNRLAGAYMRERQEVFAELEAGVIDADEAADRLRETLAAMVGRGRLPAAEDEDSGGGPAAVERWQALQLMGLDYRRGVRAAHSGGTGVELRCGGLATAGTGRCGRRGR